MARSARIVIPGVPHHVVQRANRGKALFYTDQDRRRYLDLLAGYAARHRLRIYAWCLMPDHVHLVAVPEKAGSLAAALIPLQTQYSRHIHRTQKKRGTLWRDRFASCPMDEPHMWEAVRYVERNPLRAEEGRAAAQGGNQSEAEGERQGEGVTRARSPGRAARSAICCRKSFPCFAAAPADPGKGNEKIGIVSPMA
jgi:REP element-mobilizing transposase RayT